jgi:hypothetical protein
MSLHRPSPACEILYLLTTGIPACQTVIVTTSDRYYTHLDILLALITYMALTRWRSRSPNGLARDLGLDEAKIVTALDSFPGLFRKSTELHSTTAGPQPSYTLHARYAQRRPKGVDQVREVLPGSKNLAALSDPEPTQDGTGEELDADTLRALLDFVSEQARAERESRQHTRSQGWLVVGIFVAASASVIAAVIQAIR